jgi:uncharacterized protein YndB with AHSA1/START domain
MTTQNPKAAQPAVGPFVIRRTVDASRELVWKAYTDPEYLKQWFGSKGFAMPTCSMDFRPGGFFLYCMRSSDGFEMWGKWVFREIVELERLVNTVSFSDPHGDVTRTFDNRSNKESLQ